MNCIIQWSRGLIHSIKFNQIISVDWLSHVDIVLIVGVSLVVALLIVALVVALVAVSIGIAIRIVGTGFDHDRVCLLQSPPDATTPDDGNKYRQCDKYGASDEEPGPPVEVIIIVVVALVLQIVGGGVVWAVAVPIATVTVTVKVVAVVIVGVCSHLRFGGFIVLII